MNPRRNHFKFKPPKNTVPTQIYDIYGGSILVYFPKNDKISPKNIEIAIRSAQLGVSISEYQEKYMNKNCKSK